MNYLFITGCPRSGTTALTKFLNGDNRILVGIERYIRIQKSITPEHFLKDRFLHPVKEETAHFEREDMFDAFRVKWDQNTLRYIGDKVPGYHRQLDYLAKTFPGCKILFLLRNLIKVASSYNVRAYDGKNWPESKDYRRATSDWNESLQGLKQFIDAGFADQVHVVNYESFFSGSQPHLQATYGFLGIERTPAVQQAYNRITNRWEKFSSKSLNLDDTMKAYIEEHKDKALEQWVSEIT